MPRNLSEADRKKNQFDKAERVRLLAIMKRYAPLLDNSASTLARKKIWTTIEDEFKEAGFTRKTSAQLKKYWQNYKYHCKRATAFGKENKRYVDSETNESVEWNRYQVFVDDRSATKFSEIPEFVRSLTDRLQTSTLESDCCPDAETNLDNGASTEKLNTTVDTFIDLSRVKIEPVDDERVDFEPRESRPLDNLNFQDDSLEEKKQVLENEADRLASSSSLSLSSSSSAAAATSVTTVECKTKNRIVVSNAKISNKSVTVSVLYPYERDDPHELPKDTIERGLELRSSRASSIAKRKAGDCSWNEAKYSLKSVKGQAADAEDRTRATSLDGRRFERNDNEEYRSVECATNGDSADGRHVGVAPGQDREFAAMIESEGSISGGVGTRNLGTRMDRPESRSYVFVSDYHSRLKHRLLLQRLETEEKRLKIKIAKMAIQEAQLRIKALSEDMRRTEELHRLRLARVAAGNMDV